LNTNKKDKIQLNKINKDKFYTKVEDCIRLIDLLYDNDFFNGIDLVIEPAAGSGSFIQALYYIKSKYNLTFNIVGYDIEPESEGIIQQDFLTLDLSQFDKDTTAFIGNPPFGVQAYLLNKFLNKCNGFKRIAFLGTGNVFRFETVFTFKNLAPFYIQKLNFDYNIKEFISFNEIIKVNNQIPFIWFERANTINPISTIYQDNLIEISKYINLNKPKEANLYLVYKFKDAGLVFYDKTKYKSGMKKVFVNTNAISLEKFVEIWNFSRVVFSDGKSGKYKQINYYSTIDNFLKNLKLNP